MKRTIGKTVVTLLVAMLGVSTYASPREPFNTSISKLPARKVLPVLGLFTTTTAGAKMSESIL